MFSSGVFFRSISDMNRYGVWAIGELTINGFLLTFVWILEAVIIIAGPLIAIVKTKVYPFSEKLNKWYPKYTFLDDFASIAAVNKLERDLANNPAETINNLGRGSASRYTKIHLFYLPEEEQQYLTFEKVYIESGNNPKVKSSVIINNHAIPRWAAEQLMKDFYHKRERFKVF